MSRGPAATDGQLELIDVDAEGETERERKFICPRAEQPDTYTPTSPRQSGRCPSDPLNSVCPLSERAGYLGAAACLGHKTVL